MANPTQPSFRNRSSDFGLNDTECCYLASAADALPGRWFVQRDQDDLGQSTVVLLGPEIGENTPVFLISREHGRLYLGLGLAESYLPLGPHADVQGVMECVQRTIHRLEAVTRWMAVELVTRRRRAVTRTPSKPPSKVTTREGWRLPNDLRLFFTKLAQKLRR